MADSEKHPLPERRTALSVRRIKGGQWSKIVSRFPSLKMRRGIWAESPLERDYLHLLEFDSAVTFFHTQPLQIRYILDGKWHIYTPDVLVELTNGTRQIIEIKQDHEAALPEYQHLFRLVRPICEGEGYLFAVALESVIRRQPRLSNIKQLLRYRRTSFGLRERLTCERFFSKECDHSPVPLRDLVKYCAGQGVNSASIHALLSHGILKADINQPLSHDSPVWMTGNGSNDIP